MKSEREFLNGMWKNIAELEYEEAQVKTAKIRHKNIIIKNIIVVVSIMAMFAFFIIVKPVVEQGAIYFISVVLLTATYWIDKFISGEKKEKHGGEAYEN